MAVDGSDVHFVAQVDWLTIDTDAYSNVLEVEPPADTDNTAHHSHCYE